MHIIRLAVLFGLLAALSGTIGGCARANSKVGAFFDFDTDLKLVFEVDKDINPDENHTPSPVFVRLYELSSDNTFEKADFLALYESDESALGKELIRKRELERLLPGHNREEMYVVDPETRYVALFAEFFQYKNSKFKLIFPVDSNNVIGNTVWVQIKDNKMQLRKAK